MSLDLHIYLTKPVSMEKFVSTTKSVLVQLVGRTIMLDIHFEEIEQGEHFPLRSKWITAGPCLWQISFGETHPVQLDVVDLNDSPLSASEVSLNSNDEAEKHLYAEISVYAGRDDALKWLAAAVCAIALAREANATVIDDSLYWSNLTEQDADSFMACVQRHKLFHEIKNSCH